MHRCGRRVTSVFATLAGLAGTAAFAWPSADATGRITGRVALTGTARFAGTAPAGEPIDFSGDAYCAGAHGNTRVLERAVVAGADGGLRDVVIYIRNAPAARGQPPATPVVLDQQGCLYTPHVVALRAKQTLLVRNSDETLHNVHVRAQNNKEFNIGQPIRGIESRRSFDNPEIGISVTCDVHGWMSGAIAVFDHDWFDVTSANGGFSIDGVPAGTYTIEAWHETLGTQSRQVTVGAGGDATVEFTFGSDGTDSTSGMGIGAGLDGWDR
ncbi:MAG: carboxypeptidase regulatory-like domain-containing protein [Gemmatimonadetes bacterium]|nr:carboxypeptidase regulatory-like domain-containing protein [Gemmatimonadota bacterium]